MDTSQVLVERTIQQKKLGLLAKNYYCLVGSTDYFNKECEVKTTRYITVITIGGQQFPCLFVLLV